MTLCLKGNRTARVRKYISKKDQLASCAFWVHPSCILCILKNEIHSKWPTKKCKNTLLLVLSTFLKFWITTVAWRQIIVIKYKCLRFMHSVREQLILNELHLTPILFNSYFWYIQGFKVKRSFFCIKNEFLYYPIVWHPTSFKIFFNHDIALMNLLK